MYFLVCAILPRSCGSLVDRSSARRTNSAVSWFRVGAIFDAAEGFIEDHQCVVDLLGSEVSSREDFCDDDGSRIADASYYFAIVSFQYSLIYVSADDVLKRGGLL
jgi:hypothetical protein